jgi:DNA-binding PadR family transcriptional regulator
MSDSSELPLLELVECPCAGATLDKLIQPAILVVLSGAPLHGYRIAEEIGEMPSFGGQKPDVSGVYRFLKTMERKGLVVSAWDMSASGPAKKAYELTASGQACLRKWVETLEAYRDGINQLLKLARKSVDRPTAK